MKLENFSLNNSELKNIKILVFGQIGAGKSSFINSINSVFQEQICSSALVDSTARSHSFTENLKGHVIECEKYSLPFVFMDIMGLESGSAEGSQPDDIINAILGHIKDGYKFDPQKPLSQNEQEYNTDPGLCDQSFCLVYIIAADTVQNIEQGLIEKLKIIRHAISKNEISLPQVIIMTKIDAACPLVNKDLKNVYYSKKIKEKMLMCSHIVGVPMCSIFPVKNYHDEINTNDTVDVLILKALEQIVQVSDKRLRDSTK